MRRKKRERVSCKADTLCPRCAPACKCAQAFPRIRHAQAHVRVFADLPRAKSWACGLERVIVRQRGGPEAPRVSLSSASFRFRCCSDSDTFSAPTPFRLRCRSYPDVFPTPTSFRFRRFSGSDIFSPPASSRRGSAGLFEKNAEKVAKLGGYRVAKDLHSGSAVRRKLLPNQSIILNR